MYSAVYVQHCTVYWTGRRKIYYMVYLFDFCLMGRSTLQYGIRSCSPSGSLWKMPDSNQGPLPQQSGALQMSNHKKSIECYNVWFGL